MGYKSIRVLVAEHQQPQTDVLIESLQASDVAFKVNVVTEPDAFSNRLAHNEYDVIILDYDFPGGGLELLDSIQQKDIGIPVIMLTTGHGEQAATESLRHGAFDYIKELKGYQSALPYLLESTTQKFRAIRQRSKLEQAQREATKRIRNLEAFTNNIVASIPSSLIVIDHKFNIVYVNRDYIKAIELHRSELIGKNLYEVFPSYFLEGEGLTEALHEVAATGNASHLTGIRLMLPSNIERVFNVRVSPMVGSDPPQILFSLDDVTEKARRLQQLTMLHQIGRAMQTTLELDRLFFLILTCTTAGKALGFNRAMLLLVDKETNTLRGEMAVGPKNQEEALRVWAELSRENFTLKDFLDEYDRLPAPKMLPLSETVKKISIPLSNKGDILVHSVVQRKPFVVVDAEHDNRVDKKFFEIVRAHQFVVVPLVIKEDVFGLIVADNIYNHRMISEEIVQLLSMLSTQAGLAIENAEAYNKLKEKMDELTATQERLIRSERLAAVGKMATYVAHEIRNPLVTIGGFARSIEKAPEKIERVKRNANVIVDEVSRLEKILGGVMDFSKPTTPILRDSDINSLVSSVLELKSHDLQLSNIMLLKTLADNLPLTKVDSSQLKQVLINLIQNAIEAMDNGGGSLNVETRFENNEIKIIVEDTGPGIPEEIQEKIFTPFFTTKASGNGLGMAVCKAIIDAHGGTLKIKSVMRKGTTFTITLPYHGTAK